MPEGRKPASISGLAPVSMHVPEPGPVGRGAAPPAAPPTVLKTLAAKIVTRQLHVGGRVEAPALIEEHARKLRGWTGFCTTFATTSKPA
jgi:hypothetical protein